MPPVTHSKYSASKAHRWMECPGSVRACAGIVEKPSKYAKEGTAAHSLAEKCLRNNFQDAEVYSGQEFDGFEVTDEMVDAVNLYVQEVKAMYQIHGGLLIVENKFELSHIHPDLSGTNDVCLLTKKGMLFVWDLKYGKGKSVEAKDNPQLMIYSLGAARKKFVDWVQGKIVQPRMAKPIRTAEWEYEHLVEFEVKIANAIRECEKPDAPLKAGAWCNFCPVAGTCPALRKDAHEKALIEFDDVRPIIPKTETLTDEQLEKIMDSSHLMETFLKGVESEALTRAERGVKFKKYKLVEKKGRRKWENPEEAELFLKQKYGGEIYSEPKLKSPAQIEKLDKNAKQFVNDLTIVPINGSTLVPIADERGTIPPAMEFEPLN